MPPLKGTRDRKEWCQEALCSSSWQTNLRRVIFGARTGKGLSVLFGSEVAKLEETEKAEFLQPFLPLSPVRENAFCTKGAAGAW